MILLQYMYIQCKYETLKAGSFYKCVLSLNLRFSNITSFSSNIRQYKIRTRYEKNNFCEAVLYNSTCQNILLPDFEGVKVYLIVWEEMLFNKIVDIKGQRMHKSDKTFTKSHHFSIFYT
jgi:hypothetical protein